ncbi:Proteolipid protein 2 [Merluccius polli]|uniref:Proteolipid protein 2 n=1 Tax=Merluccius polli TaxID=89951 RepID=A0AA47M331_MERPO|nr:Proteolipid protein 2 [Merluccius polli]
MVFAIIFFVIFMMELDKQIQVVNWVWSDLFRAGIGAVVYLITSLMCVIGGSGDGARIAGGVFGLLAGILFAYDAYTIYLQVRGTSQHTAASTGRNRRCVFAFTTKTLKRSKALQPQVKHTAAAAAAAETETHTRGNITAAAGRGGLTAPGRQVVHLIQRFGYIRVFLVKP